MMSNSGYEEIEHTADWALHVWAPDLDQLFELAVEGMYRLAGTCFDLARTERRSMDYKSLDNEMLLVGFLTRLVLLGEDENLGATQTRVAISGVHLRAEMELAPILSRDKEIKAVTYHNLAVTKTENGWEVTIVFDV